MRSRYLQHRWQRILAFFLLIFVFVITFVAYFVNRYWSPILAARVRETVLESTDSLYIANFSDARLHVIQGKLVFDNVTFRPDMSVYRRRLKMHLAPNNLYQIKVKRVVLKRIHPFTLYYRKKLDIGQIILSEPELQVTYTLNHTKDTTARNRRTAWQRIQPMLRSIHIGQVMMNDVKLKYKDYSGNDLKISELKEMNLTGNDLLIDSTTQFQKTRFYYFKEVQLELNNFSWPSADKLYTYHIRKLAYSTLTTQLDAHGIRILPESASRFAALNLRTRYSLHIDTLQAYRFDFAGYNKYRKLFVSNIVLKHGSFGIYTDTVQNRPSTDRLSSFPNEALRRLKTNIKIDSMSLDHFDINYHGTGKRSKREGVVSFNKTEALILNITNIDSSVKHDNLCRVEFRSHLMNHGALTGKAIFTLNDSARSFKLEGMLAPMDLAKLNPVTMPFGLFKIRSGKLDQLTFNINGNRRGANGNVCFLYHDLMIHLLKVNADTLYKHKAIASLFANRVILKHSNPEKAGMPAYIAYVNYPRARDTSFFKMIFKTVITGIKAGAGFGPETERMVKQHIAQISLDRKARAVKKASRKLRRAKRKREEQERYDD